jgi:hypothetical protein
VADGVASRSDDLERHLDERIWSPRYRPLDELAPDSSGR